LGVEAVVAKDRAEEAGFDALKLSEIEIQSMIELVPLEGDGVGLAVYATYGESLVDGQDESALAFGPLIKAARGPRSVTLNLFAVRMFDIKEIEDGETARFPDHWNLEYAWQLKHQAIGVLAFSIEGYGDFFDVNGDLEGEHPERHRLGPVVYPTLGEGPEIEFSLGVLFGLTGATSDLALKWGAELAF